MRGEVKINQKKLALRRRRRLIRIVGSSAGIIAVTVAALAYASGLPAVSLDTVIVRGNARIASTTLALIADRNIAGRYGYLFSKRNFLLYPAADIENDVKDLPETRSVDVFRDGIHSLVISVEEREQSALWCSGSALATSTAAADKTGSCYAMDDDGYVFAPASTSTEIVYRGRLGDDPIGQRFMDEVDFKRVAYFINELSKLSLSPREVELTSATSSAPYMTVVLDTGARLIVNTGDDLSAVLGRLSTVLSDRSATSAASSASSSTDSSPSDFISHLDYMRLDDGNRIVYKLK